MKNRVLTLIACLLIFLAACTPSEPVVTSENTVSSTGSTAGAVTEAPAQTASFSYSNPCSYASAGLRDPFILYVDGVWFMTGTNSPYGLSSTQSGRTKGVPLYKSTDLQNWEYIGIILACPDESEGKWYSERFWAPEIFAHNGKYYLTVNCCALDGSKQGILIAEADMITGPYTVRTEDKPILYGNDGHLFADDDGRVYLFGSGIKYAEIDLISMRSLSEWTTVISPIEGSDAWNGARADVGLEGPYVLKYGGKYYLFYSTWARGYEVGVAVADDINGEWVMMENPMYGGINADACANYGSTYVEDYYIAQSKYREVGHNCVFYGPDGSLWIAAHAFTDNGSAVLLVIDRIIPDGVYGFTAVDAQGNHILGPTYGNIAFEYEVPKEPAAEKALDVYFRADSGDGIPFPDCVDILMSDGSRRFATVIWNAPETVTAVGTHEISGTATYGGAEYPLTAHLTVYETASAVWAYGFEDLSDGVTFLPGCAGNSFADVFDVSFALYKEIGRSAPMIKSGDGNSYLCITSYFQAKYEYPLGGDYALSFSIRAGTTERVGGTVERLGGIILHGCDENVFAHYEDDRYSALGGTGTSSGSNFIGCSGIILIPTETGIRIGVKTYETDVDRGCGYAVGTEFCDIALDGITKSFVSLSVKESGGVIEISAFDTLIAEITLSDAGKYEGAEYTYYKTCTVKDASGGVLLEESGAYATTDNSFIIVSRGLTAFDLDDLQIKIND